MYDRTTARAALRSAIERDHRIDYRAALRTVANYGAPTAAESKSLRNAIVTEHGARANVRPLALASPAIHAIANA